MGLTLGLDCGYERSATFAERLERENKSSRAPPPFNATQVLKPAQSSSGSSATTGAKQVPTGSKQVAIDSKQVPDTGTVDTENRRASDGQSTKKPAAKKQSSKGVDFETKDDSTAELAIQDAEESPASPLENTDKFADPVSPSSATPGSRSGKSKTREPAEIVAASQQTPRPTHEVDLEELKLKVDDPENSSFSSYKRKEEVVEAIKDKSELPQEEMKNIQGGPGCVHTMMDHWDELHKQHDATSSIDYNTFKRGARSASFRDMHRHEERHE